MTTTLVLSLGLCRGGKVNNAVSGFVWKQVKALLVLNIGLPCVVAYMRLQQHSWRRYSEQMVFPHTRRRSLQSVEVSGTTLSVADALHRRCT